MKKVTFEAALALRTARRYNSGNTRVENAAGVGRMYLHGNLIARYDRERRRLELLNGGWNSNTTKERLNGILSLFAPHFSIVQRDFIWYVRDARDEKYLPLDKMPGYGYTRYGYGGTWKFELELDG